MIFYTYLHFCGDSERVFYIGKGKAKRAWKHESRSLHWQRVAKKHGVRVEIAANWPSEEEAFSHEKLLISVFRDLGHELVNQTNGGEGFSGGKHTDEWRRKQSESRRGKPGKTLTPEQKAKNGALLRSLPNPWIGRKHRPESIAKRTAARAYQGKKYSEGELTLSMRGWAELLGKHWSTIDYRIKTGKTPSGKAKHPT